MAPTWSRAASAAKPVPCTHTLTRPRVDVSFPACQSTIDGRATDAQQENTSPQLASPRLGAFCVGSSLEERRDARSAASEVGGSTPPPRTPLRRKCKRLHVDPDEAKRAGSSPARRSIRALAMAVGAHEIALRDLSQKHPLADETRPGHIETLFTSVAVVKVHDVGGIDLFTVNAGLPLFQAQQQSPHLRLVPLVSALVVALVFAVVLLRSKAHVDLPARLALGSEKALFGLFVERSQWLGLFAFGARLHV